VKGIERVVIHPDYWQLGTAGASHDLALIKTEQVSVFISCGAASF
jgi:hypothetical protein